MKLEKPKKLRNESDTAWKQILDIYFKNCIDYCLPDLSKLVDWSRPWSSLDKELQSISKDNEAGKRLLDKLIKVYLLSGKEQWILVHIEVQGKPEASFPNRMLTYNYRLYDKYQKSIVSCAILTDDNKEWRPSNCKVGFAGSYLSLDYLVIKLIDYQSKRAELDASSNPFASVIFTQLAALEAKAKPDEQRKKIKFSLTKRLYEKGFTRNEVCDLYRFIDWLIGLPKSLELQYLNEVYELEEEKKMPYISRAEKFGIEKGRKQGKAEGKFEVAEHLLIEGIKLALIKKTTGIPLEKLIALQKKLKAKRH